MIRIALIGCTGNIGRQVAEVVRAYPEKFCFSALACGRNAEGLAALAREFRPGLVFCEEGAPALPCSVKRAETPAELLEGCDVAFVAAGGFAGLRYTLAAAEAGKKIALANKESLVCGGELVMRAVAEKGAELVPVDSEHSAIFQALSCRREGKFARLVLTASGGPFLHRSQEELQFVTAKDALKHPTWDMGAKITIDSATLLNKGYEVIEAKWLYGADYSQIGTIVHPESIVHSLVYFEDGAAVAQLGYPDMRLPIQLALTCPERFPCCEQLDLAKIGTLHFEELPEKKFPCFGLAVEAGKAGGTCPAVLN
ncbi:MAG: 1-deoxy-D-xylulose-5-phosphate reductoisomerase, partial [Clostridia bacterium]|nr:1-deoxy-D-xylulose-5-phosphate reductoisomerase [Clostridia bacterium]